MRWCVRRWARSIWHSVAVAVPGARWVLHGGLLRETLNGTLPTCVRGKAVFRAAGLGLEPSSHARLILLMPLQGSQSRGRVVTVSLAPRLPSWHMKWASALHLPGQGPLASMCWTAPRPGGGLSFPPGWLCPAPRGQSWA